MDSEEPAIAEGDIEDGAAEGDAQVNFGKILPLLIELSEFVKRAYLVTKNTIQQLASLYHSHQKLYSTSFKNVHLYSVLDNLGELLTVLITLDEILLSNPHFSNGLALYKR